MPAGDILKKLETKIRGLAEEPFEEVRHPLTLRRRILEAVEDRVEQDGGPRAFHPRRLDVYLLAEDETRRQLLAEAFVQDEKLARDVRQHLREMGVAAPAQLEVDVHLPAESDPALPGLEAAGYALQWTAPEARQLTEKPAGGQRPGFRLVIEKGRAEQDAYRFEPRSVVHIGRLEEVVDDHGHITRRNDVAFSDEADELSATVSRAHAHLRFDEPTGRYRLYDEGSACGTSIYRPRQTGLIPVSRRGVTLQDGDLLYFGKACARFELDGAPTEPKALKR